jgi:hypothetical protein
MNLLYIIIVCLLLPDRHAYSGTTATIFFSPDERAALIASRNGVTPGTIYSVNGIIRRDSGKSAAWINNRAIPENPPDPVIPTLMIKPDHVLIENKPIKVGESLDIHSGQRTLRLPDKSVQIKP